jgi:hypothetical protein
MSDWMSRNAVKKALYLRVYAANKNDYLRIKLSKFRCKGTAFF